MMIVVRFEAGNLHRIRAPGANDDFVNRFADFFRCRLHRLWLRVRRPAVDGFGQSHLARRRRMRDLPNRGLLRCRNFPLTPLL